MPKTAFIVLAIIAISGFSGCVLPLPSSMWCDGCKWPGPTINQVAKTWVGYTSDNTMFFRVELFPNGTGRCAHLHLSDAGRYGDVVKEYWITNWKLEGGRISFVLLPASTSSWPIYLKGTSSYSTMCLEVGCPDGSWSRELVLRPEMNFLVPNRETKQALGSMAQQDSPPAVRSSKTTP